MKRTGSQQRLGTRPAGQRGKARTVLLLALACAGLLVVSCGGGGGGGGSAGAPLAWDQGTWDQVVWQ
ncbi:MAG TPA: hypothetical protein VLI06_20150 [Solimonas sp.]|nr:hypothetical protein [Solimonas sp.]